MTRLAMFPLGTALLPGGALPLHIFEPRYRAMVQDLLEGEPEFGVCLIAQGREVGGGEVRHDIATVARIVQAGVFPDGRYALMTVGTRRIRVVEWLPDDPYPMADVEDFPDPEVDGVALRARIDEVHGDVKRVLALAVELGLASADPAAELSDDPVLASYQLAVLAPLNPHDSHRFLAADDPLGRVELIAAAIADAETLMQIQLHDSGGDA